MSHSLKSILMAEDNENDIELTLAALADNNLANRVVCVPDGAEALDYLYKRGSHSGAERPLLVLLDIKMPKVTGIEVLRAMKSDPELRSIPAVMLTSSRQSPDVAECYRIGANAYVVKPVDFNEFFDAIKLIGQFWAVVNEPPAEESLEESRHDEIRA